MRVLAVDWGERRVGLALSDPGGIIASGLPTLTVKGPQEAIEGVARAAREHEAERVVVGLPLRMDGSRGEAAEAAQRFADLLRTRLGVPVETYDERLTSLLSERRLKALGVRTGHAKGKVDQGAAIALLETYLQWLASGRGGQGGP